MARPKHSCRYCGFICDDMEWESDMRNHKCDGERE